MWNDFLSIFILFTMNVEYIGINRGVQPVNILYENQFWHEKELNLSMSFKVRHNI